MEGFLPQMANEEVIVPPPSTGRFAEPSGTFGSNLDRSLIGLEHGSNLDQSKIGLELGSNLDQSKIGLEQSGIANHIFSGESSQRELSQENEHSDYQESSLPTRSTSSEKNKEMEKPFTEKQILACTCPLSLEIFVDPVITKQGFTFERQSILNWLRNNRTCPLTREQINVKDLIPNKCLKRHIEQCRKNGKLPKLEEPFPETTRSDQVGVWRPTGNNTYSDFVNSNEMVISFPNRDRDETINSTLQILTDLLNRVTNPVYVVPTVILETRPITGTYYSGQLDPVDIPVNPDFSFLCDIDYDMIQSAYNTISRLEKWDYIRRYSPSNETGYIMDNDPTIKEIITAINDEYNCHSGASLGYTMRRMQYVASYGYENFKQKNLEEH